VVEVLENRSFCCAGRSEKQTATVFLAKVTEKLKWQQIVTNKANDELHD
jgi:hypothetical protein